MLQLESENDFDSLIAFNLFYLIGSNPNAGHHVYDIYL